MWGQTALFAVAREQGDRRVRSVLDEGTGTPALLRLAKPVCCRRRSLVPPLVVGVFLVLHGLITAVIGAAAVSNGPAMTLPSWFNWWPGPFGRSWLIEELSLWTPAAIAGGLLWLVAGIALIGAGLGYMGAGPLRDLWPTLAVAGGGLGLVAVALYSHPLYAAAIVINVVLVALAWGRLGTNALGS
jgi:hypothetical protein